MHFRASPPLCGATRRLRLAAPSWPWSSPLWRTICICCRLRPRRSIRWVRALGVQGSSAMFYLAAAVSDFYVPVSEMPEHKIQSSGGPLQITMKMVPKMLSPLVKDWAPRAFIISFKLETDPSIILDRARNALEVYRHQVVIANSIESRRSFVIILTKDSETKILLSEEEVEKGVDIEEKIVDDLQSRHTAFIHDRN
ncbi:phosphopantothenate--cysteine ligase isoform X2 [Hyaena hyaena]|uniref:phosphopantothenate--cysteine ligase isoform X2 n=1 Tax=Hyaena hyaena TaxID=95912 RepID=UPI001924F0AC|nr:phosphopantothenate--cysteine ligase isoform X2 [Hyaena hyaena]